MPPLEVRFKVPPVQTGLLLPAVAVGAAFTVTLAVAVAVQPLASVTVRMYGPLMTGIAFGMIGF